MLLVVQVQVRVGNCEFVMQCVGVRDVYGDSCIIHFGREPGGWIGTVCGLVNLCWVVAW